MAKAWWCAIVVGRWKEIRLRSLRNRRNTYWAFDGRQKGCTDKITNSWSYKWQSVFLPEAKPPGIRKVGVVVVVVGKTGLSCLTLVELVVSFSSPNFSFRGGIRCLPFRFLLGVGSFKLIYFSATFLLTHNFLRRGICVASWIFLLWRVSLHFRRKSCQSRRSLDKVCSCFPFTKPTHLSAACNTLHSL